LHLAFARDIIRAPVNGSLRGRDSRAWVEVDLAAIVDNARTVARVAGTRLLPIVKANAYGVGAVAVSTALEPLDPWGYGVATIEEGAELRAAGITRPILVFMPAHAGLFDRFDEFRLTPVLGDAPSISAWTARGERVFHLEIDTGMGRSGARWDEVDGVGKALDTPYLEGCYTQFHSSDRNDGSPERQLERFLHAVAKLPRRPALLHVANSAAALRDRKFAFDLVRPGVFLYGGAPGDGLPQPKPVVSVRARVVSSRRVARGESVSYNATWTAPRDTVVATLGIGYADGIRRHVGVAQRALVILRGQPCPVIGLVTMDMLMVETGAVAVEVGDVATLIGEADGRRITLDQFAGWSGALQRELLTGLGPRLPRVYR
jgi:alanine racemase